MRKKATHPPGQPVRHACKLHLVHSDWCGPGEADIDAASTPKSLHGGRWSGFVSYRGFLLRREPDLSRRRLFHRIFSTGGHFHHEIPNRYLPDRFGGDPAPGWWLLKHDSVARFFSSRPDRLSAIRGPVARSLPVTRSRASGCWGTTALLSAPGSKSCAGSDVCTATTTSRLSLAVASRTRPFRCIVEGAVSLYKLVCSTPLLPLILNVFF